MLKKKIKILKSVKLNQESKAYKWQKEILNKKKIAAYKIAGSNFQSSRFFKYSKIMIGGIEKKNIYFKKIIKNYPIAEPEVIIKVKTNLKTKTSYKVLNYYLGLECPRPVIKNTNSVFKFIKSNCLAMDLIIYKKITNINFINLSIYLNNQIINRGSLKNLKYKFKKIIEDTISLIIKHKLPLHSKNLLIATGGLAPNFPLYRGNKLTIKTY